MAAVLTNVHLRPVDIRSDLWQIADLIELCFASQMDEDGREYLRHLRRVGHDPISIRWIQGCNEQVSLPLHGYVWVEDDRIIGNLTMVPFNKDGQWKYLLCNIAVHPDYRRRGIGRVLTEKGIQHIIDHKVPEVWLQVREDNPGAIKLYADLGFVERARRTSWQAGMAMTWQPPHHGVEITRRYPSDWDLEQLWLNQLYPPEVTWNLPLNIQSYRPNLWRSLARFFAGEDQKQWTVRQNGQLTGALIWEPGQAQQDNIWIAVSQETEESALPVLLGHARGNLMEGRVLNVNYPAGRGTHAFRSTGFQEINTLIWMDLPEIYK